MSFDGSFNLPLGDHTLKDNAPSGYMRFMVGADGVLRSKDSAGLIKTYSTGMSPQDVEQIVKDFFQDSSTINVTYDDPNNLIVLEVIPSGIDHNSLANLGSGDPHTQYHNNVRGDARYYTKTANDVLLANKQDISTLGSSVLALLLTGFTTGANAVLSATDSILEAFRKIQGQLNGKEPSITAGTILQYWRGDKTWQTLDKNAVLLPNVDNTSDANKPISVATQLALDAKYNASNPNGYETPTQLNARDTANRSRANHTGTQLANTISDFLNAVLGSVLTGISFATNTAILATDTIIVALGKIQAQVNSHFGEGGSVHSLATTSLAGFMSDLDKIKLDGIISDVILFMTSALTNTSSTTFVTIPELQIPVVLGKRYKFEAYLLFDSNATNTGIGLSMGGTATGTLRAIAQAPVSNNAGTGNNFGGPLNAINGVITTSGVGAVGTQYRAQIEGVFTATSNGFIYPQFRSETNGTQVRVNIDSNMIYKEY